MAKSLIQHIGEEFKKLPSKVFLVENNDRFLYRDDVISVFNSFGIGVFYGSPVEQRIRFEMRDKEELLILLSQDNSNYLEDIQLQSFKLEFTLVKYLTSYHIPSIQSLDLAILDILFSRNQLIKLTRHQTQKIVEEVLQSSTNEKQKGFDLNEFVKDLDYLLVEKDINWFVVCRHLSDGILKTIGSDYFDDLFSQVNRANEKFQETLQTNYHQTKNSSAVKKPKIVSKILDYLNFNCLNKKIAMVVIDGLAFWQYELLRDKLPKNKKEEIIYSWIPSITQLSRQAIFRGGNPQNNYKQGPISEEKLWKNFWKSKGINDHEIVYQHEMVDLANLEAVSKLAIVFKDLDEKMHSSTDYADLLMLTRNWIKRSKILKVVNELNSKGFTVFITSDHGNIQSKGWRGLKGREKLGTNKSGSRSMRHIEYSEKWLTDEFLDNNLDLSEAVVLDEHAIYFKNDLSFSNKENLVTHGGSHILEVLIPFIEIKNES